MGENTSASEGVKPCRQFAIKNIFDSLEYVELPVSLELVNNYLHEHDLKLGAFVDGSWVDTFSEECTLFYQKKPLCNVGISDMNKINEVVRLAFHALFDWRNSNGHQRATCLHNIAKSIEEGKELLAILESLSFGKMIHKTRTQDVPNLIQSLHHFAGLADVWKNEMFMQKASGVVAVILNSNQNLIMSICRHVSSALASGNCVLLIPKASNCLSALHFAEICYLSGLPSSVLNVFPYQTQQEYLKLLQHLCTLQVLDTEDTYDLEIYNCSEFKLYYDTIKEQNFDTRFLNVKHDLCNVFPPTAIVLKDADLHAAVVGILELFCSKNGPANTLCSVLVQDTIRNELILKLQPEFNKIQMGSCLSSADIAPVTCLFEEPDLRSDGFDCQVMCMKSSEDDFFDCLYTLDIEKSVNKLQVLKLTVSSFRTTKEAVEIFNNQNGGQNVSIWSENISVALEVAHKLKSGTVWMNCQNNFNPSSAYRFSYLDTSIQQRTEQCSKPLKNLLNPTVPQVLDCDSYGMLTSSDTLNSIVCENPDILYQTKLFYGGAFKDPIDSAAFKVVNSNSKLLGFIAKASSKDANLAVESARASQFNWADTTGFQRSKILHKIAECLEEDRKKFITILEQYEFSSAEEISKEIMLSVECLRHWSAYCSKNRGVVLNTQFHGIVLESREPLGVIAVVCPDTHPLLSFVCLFTSAIAERNTVVIVPSRQYPIPALEMCILFQKAGVPAGVINVISGEVDKICRNFALNFQVDAIWFHCYSNSGHAFLEKTAVKMHKRRLWATDTLLWLDSSNIQDLEYIHHATFNKTVWLPTTQLL